MEAPRYADPGVHGGAGPKRVHSSTVLSDWRSIFIATLKPAAAKIRSALAKALQKPAGEVGITYMGHGEGSFDYYLLVVLGEGEAVEGRDIVRDAFVRDQVFYHW